MYQLFRIYFMNREVLFVKRFIACLSVLLVLCLGTCALAESKGTGKKTWEGETVEHKGFKDLGNYVIELPDFTDPAALKIAFAFGNNLSDNGPLQNGGCTVMAKRNSKGEVIMGRNMDLDISQNAAFIFKTTFGKYQNVCVAYVPNVYLTYAEIQKLDELEEWFRDFLLSASCDCMNEKGLYMEMNLREKNSIFTNYGLHSSHGETTRDDGTPWSELRAASSWIPQLVTQNCATVEEAIEFLNNSYDWYTASPKGVNLGANDCNLCFMIGDATGEYGLVEFAQDEINYIPYQFGQANFYITPKWSALDNYAVGHGRLDMVSNLIRDVDTSEEAMDAMKHVMWRHETLWVGESHRVTDGTRLHPYNQIRFEDSLGIPQMDWRGEYVYYWPVLDDGRMIIAAQSYVEVLKADYDPDIKAYFDDALASGRMIIDDGSVKFTVNGEELNLTELFEKYNAYKAAEDPAKKNELKPYHDAYYHLLENQNRTWVHNDDNFEALKAVTYARLHIRYNDDGQFDPTAMSKYEKLLAFYGDGTVRDETPLRDDGGIWTTSLNVGVNCAQKTIRIRFWENDDIIYEFGF